MLRGILGVSRREHMRNEDIRRILHITPIDEVMRGGRLRWFGHVQRRDADNVTRRVMELALPGARRRGRPKKTWHHEIKDDMTAVHGCYRGCGPRPKRVEEKDTADP